MIQNSPKFLYIGAMVRKQSTYYTFIKYGQTRTEN